MRNLLLGLELTFVDVAALFFYMIPSFLLMVLPISCMVSVFLTFLRMSTDRELVALKAGGVSLYQLLRAPAVFSFLCMCLAVFVSLHALSWGLNSFRTTILHIANTRAKVVVQPGVFNRDLFGLTLFARQVDPVTGHMQQVIFEDQTQDEGTSITVLAPEGNILTDEKAGDLVFHLTNGRIYRVDGENVSILDFEEYSVRLDLSQLISNMSKAFSTVRPKEMSWDELLRINREQSLAGSGWDQNRVEVEIQKRWALPMACLVLGLFAMPLACSFEGVKRQVGIVLALVMFLLYYGILSSGLAVGEAGILPSYVSVWFANVLFALVAIWGLRLANKERAPALQNILSRLFSALRSVVRRKRTQQ